jgi:VWFA-related protein
MDFRFPNVPARLSRRQFGLAAAGFACCGRALRGQEATTFSTDVKVVNLLATVHAKSGQIVRDLNKDDFSMTENGRPQAIRYFLRETDLPLTLGLLVDTSQSQRRVLDAERGASNRFLDQVMREDKDKVFLMQFDTSVQIKAELTSSWRKLADAMAYVDTETRRELQNQGGGGTLLYDAIVQAARDIMKKQANRKALILLTDGVDVGSEATVADAVEAAQRSDTLIYSIEFADAGAYSFLPFGAPDGRKVLMRLSRETGGGYFEVTKKRGIEEIFKLIQEELRSQYNIGFVSDEPVRISEFRKLQLATRQKGLIVQARGTYWAQR